MNLHRVDILLGTGNHHKAKEVQQILDISNQVCEFSIDDAEIGLKFPWELPGETIDPEENGKSLAENALIKANAFAEHYNFPAIADDTGLFVDALGGAPGIYAARYAGENCTFEDNNRLLLKNLEKVNERDRTARFICVVVLAFPMRFNIKPYIVEGILEGRIATRYSGYKGFGYDSIFITTSGVSLAELSLEEKNRISHRGKAFRKMFSHIATDFELLEEFAITK
ncbi:MAG: RdgB/HAM1 family non-canonical purine NTP pyrophosphatase [Candidatus Zixiibacteriota bacterium]